MAEVEEVKVEEKVEAVKPEEETITLSKKEVQEILANQTRLEARLSALMEKPDEEEVPAQKQESKEEVDFSKMSPKDFYNHIKDTIGAPLMVAITTLAIQEEIREVKKDNEDFKDYEKEVREYMMKNPYSGVKDAYLLVKARKGPGEVKAKEKVAAEKGPIPGGGGERPGVSSAAIKAGGTKTLREAVELAAKDILK